jgi:hypothetical protein
MLNVKIPAFAEAASRRQANDKGMANVLMPKDFVFDIWGFDIGLKFEL